jgi:D-tyrosyl-tRNA(Tyr) deacylase
MRAVVQRASAASVTSDGTITGSFEGPGLVVLLGVTHDDTGTKAAALAKKVWEMRILHGERSASDIDAPLLVVSQFTLYADLRKGRRPSWNQAAPGEVSEPLYEAFCSALRDLGAQVTTGVFGAHMDVSLTNDGPVTILVEI